MFIKIDSKNIYCNQGEDSLIELILEPFYLNLNKIIKIQIEECLVKKQVLGKLVKFEFLIKLYVLVEEGIWNFLTLYFTKENQSELIRIKELLEKENHVFPF